MTQRSSRPRIIGNAYLVTDSCSKAQLFVGKAVDEPLSGRMVLEGKAVHADSSGRLHVRPFATRLEVDAERAESRLHQLAQNDAIAEVTELLARPERRLERVTYPRLTNWARSELGVPEQADGFDAVQALWRGFCRTAQALRRTTFDVSGSFGARETEQLTELEGELVTELGKLSHEIATRLREAIAPYADLVHDIATLDDDVATGFDRSLCGWTHVSIRIARAKTWARRSGSTGVLGVLNDLHKDALQRVHALLLDHCTALDALATETTREMAHSIPSALDQPLAEGEPRAFELPRPAELSAVAGPRG